MKTIQTSRTAPHVKLDMKKRQKKYPKLTVEQQKLVKEHNWIAGRLAYGARCLTGGYTGSLTIEDLESIANFALCVAATRFDPSKNIQFSTFAWTTARGYIQHALRDYSRLVRTPRWAAKYKEAVDSALKQNKSYSEIAKQLGMSEAKVLIVEMSSSNYHVSYDSSPDDWVTPEFIYRDNDVKPYIGSPRLMEEISGLTETEIALIVKFSEGSSSMSEEDKKWASEKFSELKEIAHGIQN